jgi:ATP-binding protein involved in chromosome partitioning
LNGEEDMSEVLDKIVRNISHIKYRIAVMSGKGGVGKSTVAVNLAVELAQQGARVGLLDADITGPDVAKLLGLDDKKPEILDSMIMPVLYHMGCGMKVMSMAFLADENAAIIWRGPLKNNMINQFLGNVEWGELDYLIIDLPPGTSDEPLSLAKFISFTGFALIVTTPQELALLDVKKSITFARRLHLEILGLLENMSGFTCPYCGNSVDIFKKGGGEEASRILRIPFLGRLQLTPEIVSGGDSGRPFILEQSPVQESFRSIVERIKQRIKERRIS